MPTDPRCSCQDMLCLQRIYTDLAPLIAQGVDNNIFVEVVSVVMASGDGSTMILAVAGLEEEHSVQTTDIKSKLIVAALWLL